MDTVVTVQKDILEYREQRTLCYPFFFFFFHAGEIHQLLEYICYTCKSDLDSVVQKSAWHSCMVVHVFFLFHLLTGKYISNHDYIIRQC
jgi:hypothetical protein